MAPQRFFDMLDKLEKLDQELEYEGEFILSEPEVMEFIGTLNIKQLDAGQLRTGGDIEPQYAEQTISIKKKKNQRYDKVTLEDTGAFKDGIRVRVANRKLEILSEDNKSEELQKKYSEFIFGLQDDNLNKTRYFIKPMFIEAARKYFQL